MATKHYNNGFRWGRKTIKKNFKEEGKIALRKCDKAAQTCEHYAKDKKIKRTKKGKWLNYENRQFYGGISKGFLYGYNDIVQGRKK